MTVGVRLLTGLALLMCAPAARASAPCGCCDDNTWRAPCEDCYSPYSTPGDGAYTYDADDSAADPGSEPTPADAPYGLDSDSQGMGLNDAPPQSSLPGGLGAVAGTQSPSIHMIGDFFSNGYFLSDGSGEFSSASNSGGDRRFKATDNLSPVPQDRFFFNYHHFHNAVIDVNQQPTNVNRFTFGVERTFLDEMMSLEARLPFTAGLSSEQISSESDTTGAEFGNLSLTVKARLIQRGNVTFVSGLAMVFPTSADALLDGPTGQTVLDSQSFHLQPYIGMTYSNRCSRFFSTSYVAVDVDASGDELLSDSPSVTMSGSGLVSFGDVRDQTMLFADLQVGYWVYQDYGHIGYLNGIAPILELHYNQPLEDPDLPVGTAAILDNPYGQDSLLNLTAGLLFDIRRTMSVTVYGAAPLRRNQEAVFSGAGETTSVFDAEFGLQCVVYR